MYCFSHVLNNIGFPFKEKLIRSNSVYVYVSFQNSPCVFRFKIHRYIAGPIELFHHSLYAISVNCKENPIYEFLFWELRGLGPDFHIHVSVSDLYISRISPHISLQQNRQTDPGNI